MIASDGSRAVSGRESMSSPARTSSRSVPAWTTSRFDPDMKGGGETLVEDAVTPPPAPIVPTPPRVNRLRRRAYELVGVALLGYLVVAYVLMPRFWTRYARRHPALEDIPGVTRTAEGTDGDPLNVACIGTKAPLMRAMVEARWYPADPLTVRSCLEIAEATVLKRPYDDA